MTTRSGSLSRLLCIGLLLLVPGLALAGPNEGGTLILHANPGLVFTSDIQNYCGMAALDSCSAAVTSVPWQPGARIVFHALAAFPPGSSPRLKSLSFGIDYDPAKFIMAAHGSCADFELPDGTWPAAGTGTAQSWTTGAQTGSLTEAYWFCGYAYSEQEGEDSTTVSLIPHPLQHGMFVDDGFPAAVDTIAAYGRLGLGTAGASPCPTNSGDLTWVTNGDLPGESSSEPDGEGGESTDPDSSGSDPVGSDDDGGVWTPPDDEPNPLSSKFLEARFSPGQFTFDHYRRESALLGTVAFQDLGLRDTLQALGVVSLTKVCPGFSPADTVRANLRGEPVRIPDLSGFFYLEFVDSTAAGTALPVLSHAHGVGLVTVVPTSAPVSAGDVRSNDPLFEEWPACQDPRSDAQWYLDNDGIRAGYNHCRDATSGADVRLPWGWPLGSEASDIIIGHIDVGIRDDHPDLSVINPFLTPEQRRLLSPTWPDSVDFCGEHGTAMAGPEAARTDNLEGIAGVCSACWLLDINVAAGTPAACEAAGIAALGSWGTPMASALDMSLPGSLVAFNVECAGTSRIFMEQAWASFLLGVPVVAPSADRTSVYGGEVFPASFPWVLGVGGSTWDGRFWTHKNACLVKDDSVDVGMQPGTTVGRHLVKVSAPADGSMVTTHREFNTNCPSLHLPYATGSGQCSMAAALVTGAIGFLQAKAEFSYGHGWLSADDAVGILTASALPFSEDPYTDPNRECPTCPREFYGTGVLNVAGALQLLACDSRWEERAARLNGENVVSQAVDSTEFLAWYNGWYHTWRAATIRLTLQLDPAWEEDVPEYCAWVRRVGSHSFERIWGAEFDRNNLESVQELGITGGTFGIIDQATGRVDVTGVTFGRVDASVPGGVAWLIRPEDLYVLYVNVIPAVTGGTHDESRNRTRVGWRLDVASPFQPSGTILLTGPSTSANGRSLSIVDASGRVRRRSMEGTRAASAVRFTWDGLDDMDNRVPSGVYWAVAEVDGIRLTKRMVVIR